MGREAITRSYKQARDRARFLTNRLDLEYLYRVARQYPDWFEGSQVQAHNAGLQSGF
jgi:hypothetical protein